MLAKDDINTAQNGLRIKSGYDVAKDSFDDLHLQDGAKPAGENKDPYQGGEYIKADSKF